ncbi:MAG: hypothetical protein WBB29_05985 [Geitlerinemataceae cyanobacterium]
MVRRVTPLLLSSLILGSTAELTGLNSDSHTTPQQAEDADRLYAQSDNSDEGGPLRGSSGRRILRQNHTLDS